MERGGNLQCKASRRRQGLKVEKKNVLEVSRFVQQQRWCSVVGILVTDDLFVEDVSDE